MKPNEQVERDITVARLRDDYKHLRARYKALIGTVSIVERERDAFRQLSAHTLSHRITPTLSKNTGEATAVVIASDWHVEERVNPDTVNGKNKFNLEIAKQRAAEFFMNAVKLLNKEKTSIAIPQLILHLGGDFFSSNLHEELMETCDLRPIQAAMLAKELIASGIKYLCKNFAGNIIVVCSAGNHSRVTKRIHIANEMGNSLEYMLYHTLAHDFAQKKNLKFIIEEGHHVYMQVYDMNIRFMHGHAVRYQGGIGGLTIPMNKAIAQWDKTIRADLTCCGHWHSQLDGGNFLVNGSLIGYNAFALFIKAPYETPRQLFFLIDKKRGKTTVAPILFSV